MDNSEVASILDSSTICPYSFEINELVDRCENPIDFKIFESTIINDSRFIRLSSPELNEHYFISKKILIRWFSDLSIRLCKIHQFILTKRQLALTLSHLRIEGQWDSPPAEAIQLAQSLNFVYSRPGSDSFIFPIAKLLLFIDPFYVDSAGEFLNSIYEKDISKQDLGILCANSLKENILKADKRTAKILMLRGDLSGAKKGTLREISKRLGITRERVRQIEQAWLKQQKRSFLFAFICDLVVEGNSCVTRIDSPTASRRRFLAKYFGVPFVELPAIGLMMLGIKLKELNFIGRLLKNWKSNIDASGVAKRLEEHEKIFFIDADIKIISFNIAQAICKHLNRSQKVYLALRSIGRPAHYSRVVEELYTLFSETPFSERNVHAILCREERGVIWIGIRGTYALKEWGYNRPPKTLFNTVTEIVNMFYQQTKKPVSYAMIITEMSKYRKLYNPRSVLCATYRNPRLEEVSKNFFIPRRSSHLIHDKTSEEKLHKVLESFQSDLIVEK